MIPMKDGILLQILAVPPWREPHSPREITPYTLLVSSGGCPPPSVSASNVPGRGCSISLLPPQRFQHRAGPSCACSISRKWPFWGIVIEAEQSKLADTIRLMDWSFNRDSGKWGFQVYGSPEVVHSPSRLSWDFTLWVYPFLSFVFKESEKSICKFISFLTYFPCLFSASRLEFYRGASAIFAIVLNSLV